MSRAAKVALSALTVMPLAGCTVAEAAELTATPAPTVEDTARQTTAEVITEVTSGVPMAPAIPAWPFFIATAGILAAVIWVFRRKGLRKKETRHSDDAPQDDY